MEWLSKALNQAVQERRIEGYFAGNGLPKINHLLNADDILLFTSGYKPSVENLLSLIKEFCLLSGQQLNDEKSLIFFSSSINEERRSIIMELTKFAEGTFPILYLGAPLYKGITKIEYFQFLEDKIRKRIEGWMVNFLNMAGKLALLESVLNSVSTHCMSVLPIPKTVLGRIQSLCCSFLWNKGQSKRRHWVSWELVCRPKAEGGLGVSSLDNVMLSLHGKLAWSFIIGESLWANYARKRFSHGSRGSRIWNIIDPIILHLLDNSRWIIGSGVISCRTFLLRLGCRVPPDLAALSIKEVYEDHHSRHLLLSNIPESKRDLYEQMTFSYGADSFIWEGCRSGVFSAKDFRVSYQTKWPGHGCLGR